MRRVRRLQLQRVRVTKHTLSGSAANVMVMSVIAINSKNRSSRSTSGFFSSHLVHSFRSSACHFCCYSYITQL